ncbi:MAG TPA: hypothetical protein VJC03_04570, partial [bacterium]|nr:hypothetical protein [bacterium]
RITVLMREKSKIDHRTSPTNIGLNVLTAVMEWQQGRITQDQAERRIANIVSVIEKLPKYEGHLYNWYNTQYLYVYEDNWYKEGNNKPGKRIDASDFVAAISTVDNGNFAAFLIIAANSIEDPELKLRMFKIIREMDFGYLYNKENGLLHHAAQHADIQKTEGFNSGLYGSDGHYDLLLSENRLASMIAIMQGQLPRDHWKHLKRFIAEDESEKRGVPALPWYGSSFEVKLPGIIMREDDSEMLGRVHRVTTDRQLAAGKNGVIGKSETAYNPKNDGEWVGYGPVGVAENAQDTKDEVINRDIYSPYAAMMEAGWAPEEAAAALREYDRLGLKTPIGYYESVEFKEDGARVITPRIYSHHSAGMGAIALFNLVSGGFLQEKFHSNPFNRGAVFEDEISNAEFLVERGFIRKESVYYIVTADEATIKASLIEAKTKAVLLSALERRGIVEEVLDTPKEGYLVTPAADKEAAKIAAEKAYEYEYQYRQEQVGIELPEALEGKSGYTIHAPAEGGSSSWIGEEVQHYNRVFYVKDRLSGEMLPVGLKPLDTTVEKGQIKIKGVIDLPDGNIEVLVTGWPSNEDTVEVWNIEVVNKTSIDRDIDVTGYLEWVMDHMVAWKDATIFR